MYMERELWEAVDKPEWMAFWDGLEAERRAQARADAESARLTAQYQKK
jgi:hypothetical protein